MKIFSSLSDIQKMNFKDKNLAVALGTFDGVHIGHQNVICEAVNLAKKIRVSAPYSLSVTIRVR